jgi:hypothetical protein
MLRGDESYGRWRRWRHAWYVLLNSQWSGLINERHEPADEDDGSRIVGGRQSRYLGMYQRTISRDWTSALYAIKRYLSVGPGLDGQSSIG